MSIFMIYVLLGIIATLGMIVRMRKINNWTEVRQYIVGICIVFPIWPIWVIGNVFGAWLDHRNIFKCAWCGELLDSRDMDAVKSHVAKCTSHPLSKHIIALHERIEQLDRSEAPHE